MKEENCVFVKPVDRLDTSEDCFASLAETVLAQDPEFGALRLNGAPLHSVHNFMENSCCLSKYSDLRTREGMVPLAYRSIDCFVDGSMEGRCCADAYMISIGLFQMNWAIEFWQSSPDDFDIGRSILANVGSYV